MATNKFKRTAQLFSPTVMHWKSHPKKTQNRKIKRLLATVFLSFFVIGLTSINAVASLCSNNEDNSLKDLVVAIEGYGDHVFRNAHLRRVMAKKAKSALKYQEGNEYRQAIRVLVNGVLRHADGCWAVSDSVGNRLGNFNIPFDFKLAVEEIEPGFDIFDYFPRYSIDKKDKKPSVTPNGRPDANDHIIECQAQFEVLDMTEASIREMCSHSPDEVHTFVERYWNESAADRLCGTVPGGDDANYGWPRRLSRTPIDNTLFVRFAVAGDMQFYVSGCGDADRDNVNRTRYAVDRINDYCGSYSTPCAGVVVVGDLTQRTCTQEVIAFRQLFEDSYPGWDGGDVSSDDEDCYSKNENDRINYGVYPLLGNHDDPSEIHTKCDGDRDCKSTDTCHETWVRDYIYDRMGGSHALFQPPGVAQNGDNKIYLDNYGWEWGSFHFLSLSIWPFYEKYDHESGLRNHEDVTKVTWLKDYLKALGKEKGIVIFQHFGWDSFSRDWWPEDRRKEVINVLCDRDTWEEPCEPYNIIAIISGHTHESSAKAVCTSGDHDYKGCTEGTHTFRNVIVDDAGPETNDSYGYMHVVLNGVDNTMHVVWKNFAGDARDPSDVDILPTAFLTWDTEEPSDTDGNEYCAEFKSNGRWNDVPCTKLNPIACKGGEDGWTVYNMTRSWNINFAQCDEMPGVEFGVPENLDEQKALMDIIAEYIPGQSVWINYVKLDGEWRKGDLVDALWEIPAPDNGMSLPLEPRNEDCARFTEDVLLNDIPCDQFYGRFACRKSDGDEWFIQTERGPWSHGHALCEEADGYFAAPEDHLEAWYLHEARRAAGLNEIKLWVNANDIEEEGTWVFNGPRAWVGWADSEPNGGEAHNCAVLHTDGTWNDVACQEISRSLHFGCKNYNTGAWKITTTATDTWLGGFDACRNEFGEEWKFDVPRTDTENTDTTPTGDSIWINYTDEADEGAWVRGYWTGMWNGGQPDNAGGNEDCAEFVVSAPDSYGVNDIGCGARGEVMCKCLKPEQEPYLRVWTDAGVVYWNEADAKCQSSNYEIFGDCYLAPPPDSSAAMQEFYNACEEVHGCSTGSPSWIRMYDTNHEGFWTELP